MRMPRSTPSEQGVDPSGVHALLDAVAERGLGLHSLMLARHGHVVAEGWWAPYRPDRPHLVHSISKTLTATAVGLLVDDGLLRLDQPVLELVAAAHPDAAAAAHPVWREVRVEHCLSMTVGHDHDAWADVDLRRGDGLAQALATAPVHEPGRVFTYNQVATYVLAHVVRAVTGDGPGAVVLARVLGPLGVTTLPWLRDPDGLELGFSGAHLTTETLLALAQLHLDGGRWRGEQLLPAGWVARATRGYGPLSTDPDHGPDWKQGYGFSFWQGRHGYRGDGAFGQFLVVLPEHDAVLATTAEEPRMQELLDVVWQHLLPALGPPRAASASDASVAERLTALAIPPLPSTAAASARFTHTPQGPTALPHRWSDVAVDGTSLSLTRAGEVATIAVRSGEWRVSSLELGDRRLAVAASGGWQDDDTYRAEVRLLEGMHTILLEASRSTGTACLAWRHVPLHGRDPLALAATGPAPGPGTTHLS